MKKQKFDIAETVTNNLIDIIEKTGTASVGKTMERKQGFLLSE